MFKGFWTIFSLGAPVSIVNLVMIKHVERRQPLNEDVFEASVLYTCQLSRLRRESHTLGSRGFSRVRWEFSVLAKGQHIFGRRPKPRAVSIKTWQKPETALEKSLAPRVWISRLRVENFDLTLAGQFLTPDWKMWVFAILLDTIFLFIYLFIF